MSFAGLRYLLQNLIRSISKMTPIGKGMHVFLGLLCAYEDTSLLHGSVAFFFTMVYHITATWLTWKIRINLVIFQIIPDIFQNSLFAVRRVGVFHTFRNNPEKLA